MFFTGNEFLLDLQPASGTAQCFWNMHRGYHSGRKHGDVDSNPDTVVAVKPSVIQLKSGRIYTVLYGGKPAVATYRGKSFLFMDQRVQSTVFGGYDLLTAVHVKEERPYFWMQLSKGKGDSFDQTCFSGWHGTPAEAMKSLFTQVGREFARLDKGDAAKAYGITLMEYTTAIERDPEYAARVAELKQQYNGAIENLANAAPRGGAGRAPTGKASTGSPKQTESGFMPSGPVPEKTERAAGRAEMAFVKRQRINTMTNHDRQTAAEGVQQTTSTTMVDALDVKAQIQAASGNIISEVTMALNRSAKPNMQPRMWHNGLADISIIAEAASYKLFEENARSVNVEPNLQAWRQSRRLADDAFKQMATPRADILKQFVTNLVAMDARLLALPNFEDSVLQACQLVNNNEQVSNDQDAFGCPRCPPAHMTKSW